MFDFAEETKSMTATEILNYYRNLYYTEPQVTERGIVANAINELLPNVAPVRHGEWVKMVFTDSGKFAGYKCSECGLIAKRKFSYCHCGAKMDGGKQDEDNC